MSAYLLLLYRDEDEMAAMTEDQRRDMLAAHLAFQGKYGDAITGSDALVPGAGARTIAVADGSLAVTDGPFVETKEALGGFYLVEAADLDAAVRMAADVPVGAGGGIEVRPVMDLG